jgi:putative FmdB family regulatory protein
MPTYEYECDACGHRWEETQSMNDPKKEQCVECKEKTAHRMISNGNFILKGDGWYATGGYGVKSKKEST